MKKLRKKKFLIILPSIGLGGTEKILIQYFQTLSNKKFDTKLCIIKKKKNKDFYLNKNNKIFYLNSTKNIFSIIKIYKFIKNYKPEYIISSSLTLNFILALIKFFTFLNFKLILREPNSPLEQLRFQKNLINFLIRYSYNLADKIIAPSTYIEQTLKKYFFINSKKIFYIPNPSLKSFEHSRYSKYTSNMRLKKKPYILSIGSLTKQKNYSLLIKSFYHFLNKYKKNYYLIIIGDGNEKNNLLSLIKLFSLQKNVFLIGRTKIIKRYLKHCSLYCSTSNYEGMPNSIIEALELNRKILTTNFKSGINDLIKIGFDINVSKKNSSIYSKDILKNIKDKKKINNVTLIKKLNKNFEKKLLNLING